MEALAPARGQDSSTEQAFDRLLSTLLVEMDGVGTQGGDATGDGGPLVIVVAATAHKARLDPAILRPGRLDLHLLLPLPDPHARRAILLRHMASMPVTTHAAEVEAALGVRPAQEDGRAAIAAALSERTAGMTGAQLENLCREAAMVALREDLAAGEVNAHHFAKALNTASAGSACAQRSALFM